MNLVTAPIGYVGIFPKGQKLPPNWMIAEGKELMIVKYPELYKVFKNMYGGDGVNTFGTPDFRENQYDLVNQNITDSTYITTFKAFKYSN